MNANVALQEPRLPVFAPAFSLCGYEWYSVCPVLVGMGKSKKYFELLKPHANLQATSTRGALKGGWHALPSPSNFGITCRANVRPGHANMQGWIRNQHSYMKSVTGGSAKFPD